MGTKEQKQEQEEKEQEEEEEEEERVREQEDVSHIGFFRLCTLYLVVWKEYKIKGHACRYSWIENDWKMGVLRASFLRGLYSIQCLSLIHI